MPKRKIIISIIILAAVGITGLLFVNLRRSGEKGEKMGGDGFFYSLWPFGGDAERIPETRTPTDISGYVPPAEIETSRPEEKLRRVSLSPVAGYGVFMKERFRSILQGAESGIGATAGLTEFAPLVRYAERATGHVYQTFADRLDPRRFSSTTIPNVEEALFGLGGESVIMRYLKETAAGFGEEVIETFIGVLPREELGADRGGENEARGVFLPENVRSVSVSPDGRKIFYLAPAGEGSVGIVMDLANRTKTQVFESPLIEWIPEWKNTSIITLATAPSGATAGYLYYLKPETGEFGKILGGMSGLTALPAPDGKSVLYAEGDLSLFILNTETRERVPAGVRTLPEKCAWSPDGAIYCAVPKSVPPALYPDAWYMREVSFSDNIWRISPKNGNATLLLDLSAEEVGIAIDGVKLSVDEDGKYLFLTDKEYSYLWEVVLE